MPYLRQPRELGLPVTLDSGLLAFAQWLISQGIGVAVAVAVLWLVGRKVDQMTAQLVSLQLAIATLTALLDSHTPSNRLRDGFANDAIPK